MYIARMLGFVCLYICSSYSVLAEQIKKDGYELSVTAHSSLMSKYEYRLEVSGRISGESCKNLGINMFFINENGYIADVLTSVNDVSPSGSRIVSGASTVFFDEGDKWKLQKVFFDCDR